MKWIRIWVQETLQGTTFQELEATERGIWFSLLVLAGANIRNSGIVELRDGVAWSRQGLAEYIACNDTELIKALNALKINNKIEFIDGTTDNYEFVRIAIKKWSKYQTRYDAYYKKDQNGISEGIMEGINNGTNMQGRIEVEEDQKKINLYVRAEKIILFWNRLSRWAKRRKLKGGLIEFKKANQKTKSAISQRLDEYDDKTARRAIYNYHIFLLLPKEQKRWQGYQWNIFEFMVRGKDNIARFSDWDIIAMNWLAEKPEIIKEYISYEAAINRAKSELTAYAWVQIGKKINPEQWDLFVRWVHQQNDNEMKRLLKLAAESHKKEKGQGG